MAKLLSIIIPVYNEERIISASLPKIFDLEINKEVIVVNDGSRDKTASILEDLQKKYPFTLIHKEKNSGKGNSVKLGLENIKGDYFIICDADLEYDPRDIIFLFGEIEKIYQANPGEKIAIYGSRFLNKKDFSLRHFVNWTLTAATNSLFGRRLTDMETCFKLIPKKALANIRLDGKRFEIEPEITAKLIKSGYEIIEKPIKYKPRGYSEGKKIKARDWLLAIRTLLAEKLSGR